MRVDGAFFLFSLSLSLLTCPMYAQCEGGRCNGDNNGDGEVTISELIQSVNVALGGCSEDTCQAAFPSTGGLPATGQRTSYGTGDDGDIQAGAALSYTDNGNGTITDNNTSLMWEVKDANDAGSVHDWNNTYTWSDSGTDFDGTVVGFLDKLNSYCDDDEATPCTTDADCAGASNTYTGNDLCGHAGYRDWRLANYKELLSILDLEHYVPAVDPLFHDAPNCAAGGCYAARWPDCSCTQSLVYWSSTTYSYQPDLVWVVLFYDGYVGYGTKSDPYYVRAVRGGS